MAVSDEVVQRAYDVLQQSGAYARRLKAKGLPFELFQEFDDPASEGAKAHIIKGVFAWGETSAWIGAPGSLKSSLLADAAVSVAAGKDWHGFKNKGAVGVVYFALERADLVRRRLLATAARLGVTEKLSVAVVPGIVSISTQAAMEKIAATISEIEIEFLNSGGEFVGLVIFDTFAKLVAAGGGDEDKAKDLGQVFTGIQRLKDRLAGGGDGPHIALIGHTGKDESRGARGSNAFLGDTDLMVTISGDAIKTAAVTKANDAPEGPLFSFQSETHEFGHDEDGDPITVNIVKPIEGPVAPARKSHQWPGGLRLIRDCIISAMDAAIDHRVAGDGPTVKAVTKDAARAIHRQRYVNTGDGKRDDAERQAWSKNFKRARADNLISGEVQAGQELIWLVT